MTRHCCVRKICYYKKENMQANRCTIRKELSSLLIRRILTHFVRKITRMLSLSAVKIMNAITSVTPSAERRLFLTNFGFTEQLLTGLVRYNLWAIYTFGKASAEHSYSRIFALTSLLLPSLFAVPFKLWVWAIMCHATKAVIRQILEPGSSVSIVSDYGLDDRAIGVRSLAEVKDLSSNLCVRLTLRPTQPPVQWVPGFLSPG
jgi:hypothetical protein